MRRYISYIIPIILIFIVFGGFFVYQYYQNKPKPVNWLKYSNEDFKFKVNYPETFQFTKISEEDKKANITFRAEQNSPSALFSIKYEKRVGLLTIMQQGSPLDVLAKNVNKQYPTRFTNFKKEKEEKITVDGQEAAQFYFTYLGTNKQTRMKQRFVIVTKEYEKKELGTVAFYLAFQSQESDFDKVNPDFQKILDSFKFS